MYRIWLRLGDVAFWLRWDALYWNCLDRAIRSYQRRIGRKIIKGFIEGERR